MNDHAAGSLQQRLYDDRGNLVMPLLQKPLQILHAIDHATGPGFTGGAPVTIGGMNPQHRNAQSVESSREWRIRAGGHRAYRVAMVRMLQSDDAPLFRTAFVLPELDRHL